MNKRPITSQSVITGLVNDNNDFFTVRLTSGWLRIFLSEFPSQLEEEEVEQSSEI